MQSWDSIQVLSNLAITSEYFLQVTLDKSGKVLSSDSGIGPIPSLFDHKEKPIYFSDCFLASDWSKYENQRIKAWKSSHQSFLVDLQKINHPDETTVLTKWEFFFITEDFGTCLGLGHPLDPLRPYNLGLGEFIDGTTNSNELVDILLENKLLGFWDFDPESKTDYISSGLAQMLGYTEEEIIRMKNISWKNHIHPDDYPGMIKDLALHFKTTGNLPFRREFRIISKGNQISWVISFGKTTKWDEAGRPRKMQGLLIDITEKKKQEIWMKEHHYFLRDLAFQQSHSLRARVANILGILEILDIEQQTPESRKLLEILKKESTQLDQALKKSIKESVNQNKSWERGIGTE
ncbi:PAS domain-containing protein [Algoriphagus boritolerans]|uniref:histidine kinase n=1 Tax=Algoriphagus boritolerans DSM 17298 = JCM 18970 TaxID=1120964 RepID=A0A1H5X8J3_9BACT|nr:PAS domain-containing protein [Algoriphagus boritolerans]SEG07750.1 PAS domain S-box-containing protein [Algoriphagus boritolerans DSM 17298 = JCM 18970]